MKRSTLTNAAIVVGLAVLATILLTADCGTKERPVTWPAKVRCDDRHPLPGDVQSSVWQVLWSGDAQLRLGMPAYGSLQSLASKHSPELVACAVDTAIGEFEALIEPADSGLPFDEGFAADDKRRRAAADRGREFLQHVGTSVEVTQ